MLIFKPFIRTLQDCNRVSGYNTPTKLFRMLYTIEAFVLECLYLEIG